MSEQSREKALKKLEEILEQSGFELYCAESSETDWIYDKDFNVCPIIRARIIIKEQNHEL